MKDVCELKIEQLDFEFPASFIFVNKLILCPGIVGNKKIKMFHLYEISVALTFVNF